MLIVFQRGSSRVPHSTVSVTSLSEGAGGKMYSFWAMNSLRMSFWSVPGQLRARHAGLLGGHDVHRPDHGGGRVDGHRGADLADRQAVEQDLHVRQAADRHAAGPELALGHRVVMVVAVQGRHVVRDREAGAAGGDQLLEAIVRVLGGAEAGEHAHRPQPAAMAGRMDAAREGRLAGQAEVVDLVPADRVAVRRAEPVARAARVGVIGGVAPGRPACRADRSRRRTG